MAYFDNLFSTSSSSPNTTKTKTAAPVQKASGYFGDLFSNKTVEKPAEAKPTYKPIFSKVGTHKFPAELGGGEFNLPANDLTTSTRSQDPIGPTKAGAERDHIIPVSLGGTSSKENLQYLNDNKGIINKILGRDPSPEERQAGKMSVEWQVIEDYKNKKISLAEARGKILQKQREIQGLDPKQGVAPYIVPAVKETVQDVGKGFKSI